MINDETKTVVIDGITFERPFKGGAVFAASVGAPIGSWLVSAESPDGAGFLTIPDARVLAAFGIEES